MAVQLDRNVPADVTPPQMPRRAALPPAREIRSSRDDLVRVARQTLVQMRAGRRSAWLSGPRGGTRV